MTERLPVAVYGILVPGPARRYPFPHHPATLPRWASWPLHPDGKILGAWEVGTNYEMDVSVLRIDLLPDLDYDAWLADFDRIEGVDHDFYQREVVPVAVDDLNLDCWIYVPTYSTTVETANAYWQRCFHPTI